MPKLPAAAVVFLLLVPPTQPPAATVPPPAAEFPPQDGRVSRIQREGLTAKLAARRLAEAPVSPETVRLLAQAKDLDGLLATLRLIVDTEPRRIADAFEALGFATLGFRGDERLARARADALKQIVADARRRLPDLPREEAARAERVFISLDGELSPELRQGWPARLARFIGEYRGTETALLAEVDAIGSRGITQQMFDALDAFIQAHAGTTAAAKALYQKGFHWHTINTLGTLEPRDADPTGRFMRVLTVVEDLESGRYPPSEWVEKAPSLIVGFFMPRDAKIAPDNIDRLIEAYRKFAGRSFETSQFPLPEDSPEGGGVGYVITSKAADLFELKGDRVGGVEGMLADLENGAREPSAVRYLRALFYMQRVRSLSGAEQEAMLTKTREELASLSADGAGLYHRKGLATLANLEFQQGDYAAAGAAYRKYAADYPESDWTWVALVRAGHCEEELGNDKAAAAVHLEAAARHADVPLAHVLGHAYAARAFEAQGEFDRALMHHQHALEGWDNAFGLRYSTYARRPAPSRNPFEPRPDQDEVTKESLPRRIAQLQHALGVPGGALLEYGRALLAGGRYEEAAEELQRMVTQYPQSPAAPEARALGHRARLERALVLADVERPGGDGAAAIRAFEALAREPVDFAVTAARIARASLFWTQGDATSAEKWMLDALTAWHEQQRIAAPAAGLESDVAGIRRAVFLPRGGGIYAGGRWDGYLWPASPFLLVNSEVRVKRHDGEVLRLTLPHELPAAAKVIFFDSEQIARLKSILSVLGGTRRRQPAHVMEVPNQPVGDSMLILKLWNRFFPARPGHWGGWEIETYPVVTEIEFADPERTKASARVTIGYSGGVVELEKEGGRWVAKRVTGQWIT